MNRLNTFFGSGTGTALCAIVLPCLLLISSSELPAQEFLESNWQVSAESRLKAIYDRGEFRAKAYRPVWLNDNSGFVVEEVDPATGKPTQWFHDAKTGEQRIWQSDEKLLAPEDAGHLSYGSLRLEARREKLIVVDQNNQQETVLISAPAGRDVQYRDPVWSPDGARVVFIEADYTDVRQRSVLVPGDPSYPEVQQHRFARVGGTIEKLRIGVVDASGQNMKWLPVECPEEGLYLGQVEWAGNSDEVLVEKFSRFRDRRDFLLVTVSGTVNTIYSETNDAWVESSQGKNSGLVWLQGGKEFVVVSEKDGWRHAWRYSRDGKELALLTPGDYDMIDRAMIDEASGWYYFYASPEDATQKYLYRVALDGSGKMQRLSPDNQPGTHSYVFSPDAKWAIHTYSTLNLPPVHELIEVETHRVVSTLEDNHAIRERMNSISCQPAEFLKLDIGNGLVFDAWMLKPRDFDPSKKYPLFIYVYG